MPPPDEGLGRVPGDARRPAPGDATRVPPEDVTGPAPGDATRLTPVTAAPPRLRAATARAAPRRWPQALAAVGFLATLLCQQPAWAQKIGDALGKESITTRPVVLMVALAALTLVPFVLIMVTSFVKLAVVLSVVRQAIGTQQIPPTQVITGLATVLSVYIMMPVGLDIYHDIREKMVTPEYKGFSLDGLRAKQMVELWDIGQAPMRGFLIKHAHLKDRDMFYKLAWKMRKPRDRAMLTDTDWSIIVPAFTISELKESFQIGFILFVPFLVVDMVVSNILMALGMQMLSPTTISLPFKILLFVLVDGWYLITRGLVLGYQ